MGLVCSRGPSANALPEPATPEPEPRGWQVHAAAAPRVDSGAPPTLQALCVRLLAQGEAKAATHQTEAGDRDLHGRPTDWASGR